MKYYAGVGSRKTPDDVCAKMTFLARILADKDYRLRSGHAKGADQAFEAGAPIDQREIFVADDATPEALELAKSIHPAWHACKPYVKALHARNCFQILGKNLNDPVKFVLCWTPCGSETENQTSIVTGGTRTAIVLAHRRGIPVFNMFDSRYFKKFVELIKEIDGK